MNASLTPSQPPARPNPLAAMQRATLNLEAQRQSRVIEAFAEKLAGKNREALTEIAQATHMQNLQVWEKVAAELKLLRDKPQPAAPNPELITAELTASTGKILAAATETLRGTILERRDETARPLRRTAAMVQLILTILMMLAVGISVLGWWWWKQGQPTVATSDITKARQELIATEAALLSRRQEMERLMEETSRLGTSVTQNAQAVQVTSQSLGVLRAEIQRLQKMQEAMRPLLVQGEDGRTYIAVDPEAEPVTHGGKKFLPVAQ